jgi:hypothetical protein
MNRRVLQWLKGPRDEATFVRQTQRFPKFHDHKFPFINTGQPMTVLVWGASYHQVPWNILIGIIAVINIEKCLFVYDSLDLTMSFFLYIIFP